MPHHQDHDPQLWCIFHRIPDSDTQELIQSKISVLRSKRFEPSAAEPHPAITVYRIVYFYCLYSSSEARSARLPDSKTLIETWSFMMMYLTRSLVINTHLPSKQNVKFFCIQSLISLVFSCLHLAYIIAFTLDNGENFFKKVLFTLKAMPQHLQSEFINFIKSCL